MADDLLTYYERELSFVRQMGAEFAAKYPKIASRLLLESDASEDPHVERLIQAFAFLAASAGKSTMVVGVSMATLGPVARGLVYAFPFSRNESIPGTE